MSKQMLLDDDLLQAIESARSADEQSMMVGRIVLPPVFSANDILASDHDRDAAIRALKQKRDEEFARVMQMLFERTKSDKVTIDTFILAA
jgi:hypothetical protein